MERDWYRRLMLTLSEAKENRAGEFLEILDSELDSVAMRLDGYRKGSIVTAHSLKKGLNLVSQLRDRLESCCNSHEVRQVFLETDELRDLVAEAEAALEARE